MPTGIEAWQSEHGGGVWTRPAGLISDRWYFSLRRHLTEVERAEFEEFDDLRPGDPPGVVPSGATH